VVRGDDVRRVRNVLEARHRDAKQRTNEPSGDATNYAIEARRVEWVRMDELVERTADKLPVLGTCVASTALSW
jgi:hypothetical protein